MTTKQATNATLTIRTYLTTGGLEFEQSGSPVVYQDGGGFKSLAEMRAELRSRFRDREEVEDIEGGLSKRDGNWRQEIFFCDGVQ